MNTLVFFFVFLLFVATPGFSSNANYAGRLVNGRLQGSLIEVYLPQKNEEVVFLSAYREESNFSIFTQALQKVAHQRPNLSLTDVKRITNWCPPIRAP